MSETNPSVAGGAAAKIGSFADLFNLYRDLVVSLSRFFGGKEVVQSAEIKGYREIACYAARCG